MFTTLRYINVHLLTYYHLTKNRNCLFETWTNASAHTVQLTEQIKCWDKLFDAMYCVLICSTHWRDWKWCVRRRCARVWRLITSRRCLSLLTYTAQSSSKLMPSTTLTGIILLPSVMLISTCSLCLPNSYLSVIAFRTGRVGCCRRFVSNLAPVVERYAKILSVCCCCCCCCHDEPLRHCLYGRGENRCPEEMRNSTRLLYSWNTSVISIKSPK